MRPAILMSLLPTISIITENLLKNYDSLIIYRMYKMQVYRADTARAFWISNTTATPQVIVIWQRFDVDLNSLFRHVDRAVYYGRFSTAFDREKCWSI
jgi:hypothetical protein